MSACCNQGERTGAEYLEANERRHPYNPRELYDIVRVPPAPRCIFYRQPSAATMQATRSSFASFDTHERNGKGINGALTPARPHRSSHHQKNTNDYHHPASTSTPNPAYPADQTPSRLRQRQQRLVGGEGISLQETEARIDELERGEFDLKLKLFYMEEQLASATSGDDGLHLHKEVIDAKLVRTLNIDIADHESTDER